MSVCTLCNVVSLLTTSVNFNTPPLTMIAPFNGKTREQNARRTNTLGRLLRFCHNDLRSPASGLPTDSWEDTFKCVFPDRVPTQPSLGSSQHLLSQIRHRELSWALSRNRRRCDQSELTLRLVTHCLLLFLFVLSLPPSWSIHGAKWSTLPPFRWFHSVLHPSRCSQQIPTSVCFFRFCTFKRRLDSTDVPSSCSGVWDSMVSRTTNLQNTNPANLQCCCGTEGETGFVPHICTTFCGKKLF